MAVLSPELAVHREWLGQIQPVGLVVSPSVLVKRNVGIDRQVAVEKQALLRVLLESLDTRPTFLAIARDILEWPEDLLVGRPGGPTLPESLTIGLPEYDDTLSPTYALVPDGARGLEAGARGLQTPGGMLALISVVSPDTDLDRPPAVHAGWRVSPHARLERLLRETGVPIGLLFNGDALRLVYAPRGESSGHLTFILSSLIDTLARPMVGALHALLGVNRVTDVLAEDQRLPALLHESRQYQNEVSTALSTQVLDALWELLRGFQRANDDSKGQLLAEALRDNPREVYGGLLSTLMRLVFILYAEDRGLMPQSDVYQRHYSVSGLFHRLREDDARYPDTMDARYGAWAQLLSLFRLIHDGGGHGELRFPERRGRLFDPDAYPFLEGRPLHSTRQLGQPGEAPRVPDGTVFRVLRNLLILDGERLSYRALDVEQIGSVYEAMMGFALEQASGPSIALAPKHIVVNLDELLSQKGTARAKWLKENAELKLSSDRLAKATTVAELNAALGPRVSRYTPQRLDVGAMYLQPTAERRRSGSHYTPRSLTEPIVRTTFRPILERLGSDATPDQILGLKVCDPAMGSGAFLVEACRLLGERLVRAWDVHKVTPKVPDDEDVLTYARRLVAERCLYGVDKNIFAVDLAKLSLWLATLAREHPFTFLDHALRHGDSLVGLSREQIACLHWNPGKQLPLIRGRVDARVAEAQCLREQIHAMNASDDVPSKERLLRDAEEALADVRLIGDVVVSAFFEGGKPKEREIRRTAYAGTIQTWLDDECRPGLQPGLEEGLQPERLGDGGRATELRSIAATLHSDPHAIPAFHWEIEFPEVFTRANGGFDVFVGNPPFAGKNTISAANRDAYLPWLLETHEESHGNADLVAHFYRRAFDLLRDDGAFGLIATNTIAQGDTRGTGLRWIRTRGGTIFAARRRIKWPGEAAVVVSIVHVAKGAVAGPYDLDGRSVDRITAFLFHTGGDDDPKRLAADANKSFQGSIVLGMGFTFDDTDKSGVASPLTVMGELLKGDSRNAQRIAAFVGYEEVATSPTHAHHRYVINFGQMPLRRDDIGGTWVGSDERSREKWLRTGVVPLDYPESVAADWPGLLAIVEQRVKPERDKLSGNPDALRRRTFWWQWGRYTPALFDAIRGLESVLVNSSQAATHCVFVRLTPQHVFSSNLNVFSISDNTTFAILQCRVHELWARAFGSTVKDDLSYTPTTCFETFPFPCNWQHSVDVDSDGAEAQGVADPLAAAVGHVGREYYEFRAELMVRNNEGLTKMYNRFHDPDEHGAGILRLRELHDAMDRAVLDAYGWTDIRPTCEFILDYDDDDEDTPGQPSRRRKPWRYRWPDAIRDEVLGRLLALNTERSQTGSMTGTHGAHDVQSLRRDASKLGTQRTTPLLD